MPFFDGYVKFYSTSMTSASPDRLNARYEAIIESNRDLFCGKRILDIASHDGRWSFTAIQAGASQVIGIEARSELVENANHNFEHYEVDKSRYKFIQGDVFEVLSSGGFQVDVVLCLGYMYHTIRHAELIDLIDRCGASHIILDTEIVQQDGVNDFQGEMREEGARKIWKEPVMVQMIQEPVEHESMAYQDSMTRSGFALVARPSEGAIEILLDHFGYSVQRLEWASLLFGRGDAGQLKDYADGWRGTFVCSKRHR